MMEGLALRKRLFCEDWLSMLSQHAHWVLASLVKRAPEPKKLFDVEKFRKKWDQLRRKERLTMEQRKEMVREARERRENNGH